MLSCLVVEHITLSVFFNKERDSRGKIEST